MLPTCHISVATKAFVELAYKTMGEMDSHQKDEYVDLQLGWLDCGLLAGWLVGSHITVSTKAFVELQRQTKDVFAAFYHAIFLDTPNLLLSSSEACVS